MEMGQSVILQDVNYSGTNLTHNFFPRDKVPFTVTKRAYNCVILSAVISLNCHSSNLIYLMT